MKTLTIRRISQARIPTPEGEFKLSLYQTNQDEKEHLALTIGDLSRDDILVRIHSECFTGDVLGSLRCDCGPQLREAMRRLAEHGHGVILYLRQEGRGIGLAEKLKAYNLQDDGYDTVEANLLLGHGADERDYSVGALMLRELGVRRLRLLTNNPAKIEALETTGLVVTERVSLQTGVHRENEAYLQAKVERMRHLLNVRTTYSNGQHDPTVARPRVTLSYAQSLDGSITVQRGESTAISGPDSLSVTHQLRAEHDAILVGIGTVLADDPQLTVRHAVGADPQPVILDSALRFPVDARLLDHPTHAPWIITTPRADAARQRELEAAGAVVIRVPAGRDGRVDLAALLEQLYGRALRTLMVEGGAAVITSFLAARLVDRVVLTVAPIYIGGLNAVEDLVRVNGRGRPQLHNPTYRWAGRDLILSGDVCWVDALTMDDAGG